MKGFSVFHIDMKKDGKGSGLLLYSRKDTQTSLLSSKSKCNIETFLVVVNLRKRKSFLHCSYNLQENLISNHLECLNRDKHSNSFDNFIFYRGCQWIYQP